MFLFNLGYLKNAVGEPHGVVYQASQVPSKMLTCRPNLDPDISGEVFLDPQLYLHSILRPKLHEVTCANLVSYPWIPGQTVEYSHEMSLHDWRQKLQRGFKWDNNLPSDKDIITSVVKQCFDFQVAKEASGLIIPVPLIENPKDYLITQMKWIDAALDLKDDYEQSLYVTIPLWDELIVHSEPEDNPLIETILDHIGVRDGISGVYLLVVKSRVSNIRIIEKRMVKTLFFLSSEFANSLGLSVMVNFVDDLGLFCLAVGAQFFGSGFWRKRRQIHVEDFIPASGGRRYPSFYSAKMLADFRPEGDLDRLQEVGLAHFLEEDYTDAGADLLDAFKVGRKSGSVPTWEQAVNNDTTANLHRVLRLTIAAEEMNNSTDKLSLAIKWLKEAEMRTNYLRTRFGEDPLSEDFQHLNVWRSAFEGFLDLSK